MPHSNFVHLHLHTQYSLLDGAIKLDQLFERAREFRMPAVAGTDHPSGNQRSWMPCPRGLRIAFLASATLALVTGCASPQRGADSPIVRVSYVQGKREGSYTLHRSTGGLMVAGQYRSGLREGVWKFYESSGSELVELTYQHGAREGPCRMWYGGGLDNGRWRGNRKLEMTFHQDRVHGEKLSWYPEGGKRTEVDYQDGMIHSARAWKPSGEETPPDEALRIAGQDVDSDNKFLGTLDSIIENGFRRSLSP